MTLSIILTTYWPFLTGLVLFILAFGKLMNTDNDQEKRILKLEQKMEDFNPVWVEIKERLASIEATLKFLTKDK